MYKASVSHGSFEDFRAPGSYSTFKKSPFGDTWNKSSMMESIIHYLQACPPPALDYSDHLKAGHLHDEVLLDLQLWKKRNRSSHRKLNILRDVISSHILPSDDAAVWNAVLNDVNYLRDQFHDYSQSLEQMVMVATSLIQLLDSRRSILETINTKRLTFLVLVFLPFA
ncbi:hypothetical protein FOPG_13723 [Fusarium oxysporum f. sp. conglutinans race 2 54008]|uniref:Uncharacterized protein n=1 Tax=Fusarium oxysporum f. sp. conglutinans race 2 54008 TaxID=1089457 RepID=X0HFA7_FUSOX|nr:hypothetical protein FOPG_13723 [Fusarium oxysporum f. sp. conglutinans race 2 54008]